MQFSVFDALIFVIYELLGKPISSSSERKQYLKKDFKTGKAKIKVVMFILFIGNHKACTGAT